VLVTEGQGVGISEEKSGLEGVDDQGFERLVEEHSVVQAKGAVVKVPTTVPKCRQGEGV